MCIRDRHRSQAYIGVLIDDLVTKGTNEPYRMFTSRSEYRLLLREDNADLRLCEIGHQVGLLDDASYRRYRRKKAAIEEELERIRSVTIYPQEGINDKLKAIGTAPLKTPATLADLLKRPEITYKELAVIDGGASCIRPDVAEQVEIQIKYEGYIRRQQEQVEQVRSVEWMKIPENIDYKEMPGLSREVVEKLERVRPRTIGQASRISGITPAAITVLMIYLKRMESEGDRARKAQ